MWRLLHPPGLQGSDMDHEKFRENWEQNCFLTWFERSYHVIANVLLPLPLEYAKSHLRHQIGIPAMPGHGVHSEWGVICMSEFTKGEPPHYISLTNSDICSCGPRYTTSLARQ
jgi:hypothetical protein